MLFKFSSMPFHPWMLIALVCHSLLLLSEQVYYAFGVIENVTSLFIRGWEVLLQLFLRYRYIVFSIYCTVSFRSVQNQTTKPKMTMALSIAVSSMDTFVSLLLLAIVLGIFYVFYPALSISKTRSKVTEKVVSKRAENGKLCASDIIAYCCMFHHSQQ